MTSLATPSFGFAAPAPELAPARSGMPFFSPPAQVMVEPGPMLLADLDDGPSLAAHRARFGAVGAASPGSVGPQSVEQLAQWAETVGLAGRGGAGFPFHVKLRAAAAAPGGRRPIVVVNLAEGEPLSGKDTALARCVPHRVLDGAALTAGLLGAREVHVVVPRERPLVEESMALALAERHATGERLGWRLTAVGPGFVSGQARAVIEALSGRPGLPVTAWQPEAVSGLRGRPTLLSNAETWAHVWALASRGPDGYAELGTADEPGTTLLSVPGGDNGTVGVFEAGFGTSWSAPLGEADHDVPVLLGGFHGTWTTASALTGMPVSRVALRAAGLALGAGVAWPLPPGVCPVEVTASITAYLAGQSAQRCGPCRNGLPALATEVGALARGVGVNSARIEQLAGLVERRGACAHPDGTVRLVRSLVSAFGDEVAAHLAGRCEVAR